MSPQVFFSVLPLIFFCSHVYLFFSTKVAYYEYIDVGSNLVDPIIPRISVWEDNVLSKFRNAELSIKHIQVCLSSQHIIFFNISFFLQFQAAAFFLKQQPVQFQHYFFVQFCVSPDKANWFHSFLQRAYQSFNFSRVLCK